MGTRRGCFVVGSSETIYSYRFTSFYHVLSILFLFCLVLTQSFIGSDISARAIAAAQHNWSRAKHGLKSYPSSSSSSLSSSSNSLPQSSKAGAATDKAKPKSKGGVAVADSTREAESEGAAMAEDCARFFVADIGDARIHTAVPMPTMIVTHLPYSDDEASGMCMCAICVYLHFEILSG
jgi:hypothetical protein